MSLNLRYTVLVLFWSLEFLSQKIEAHLHTNVKVQGLDANTRTGPFANLRSFIS